MSRKRDNNPIIDLKKRVLNAHPIKNGFKDLFKTFYSPQDYGENNINDESTLSQLQNKYSWFANKIKAGEFEDIIENFRSYIQGNPTLKQRTKTFPADVLALLVVTHFSNFIAMPIKNIGAVIYGNKGTKGILDSGKELYKTEGRKGFFKGMYNNTFRRGLVCVLAKMFAEETAKNYNLGGAQKNFVNTIFQSMFSIYLGRERWELFRVSGATDLNYYNANKNKVGGIIWLRVFTFASSINFVNDFQSKVFDVFGLDKQEDSYFNKAVTIASDLIFRTTILSTTVWMDYAINRFNHNVSIKDLISDFIENPKNLFNLRYATPRVAYAIVASYSVSAAWKVIKKIRSEYFGEDDIHEELEKLEQEAKERTIDSLVELRDSIDGIPEESEEYNKAIKLHNSITEELENESEINLDIVCFPNSDPENCEQQRD